MPVGFPNSRSGEIEIPSGFNWPLNLYPLKIFKNGMEVSCDFIPENFARSALSGTVYFVDVATGSDSNTGLTSYANAVQSIWKAVQLGNTGGVPYTVMVKAGTYKRAYQCSDAGGATKPTQDAAFIADGGRVITGPWDDLTWALDGTYTNCYKAARTNVTRVFDLLNTDSFGGHVELTPVASATICNSTPGSWYNDGTNLYVRRTDGAAVTNANTRAMLLVNNFVASASSKSIYFGSNVSTGGFDFEGGSGSCFQDVLGHTGDIVAVNCSFKYAGSPGTLFDGFRVDNLNGLVALVNCTSNSNAKDGFNFHNSAVGVPYYALTINCVANNNGRYTSASNNGHTGHENVVAIDISGSYDSNYGGTFVWIGNTSVFCAGTKASRSYGDTSLGGSGYPIEFNVYNSAKMWLDTCTAIPQTPSKVAVEATSLSLLKTRNCNFMWGAVTGNVSAY